MKRLSCSFKWAKWLLIGLILYMLFIYVYWIRLSIIGHKLEMPVIIITGLILSFSFLLYLIDKLKKVDFDSDYLYITGRDQSINVPIENIIKVKMIMIEVGTANFYKIGFKTSDGKIDSVRLLPTNNFDEFVKIIKEKNEGFKTQNWSHSFDFDL